MSGEGSRKRKRQSELQFPSSKKAKTVRSKDDGQFMDSLKECALLALLKDLSASSDEVTLSQYMDKGSGVLAEYAEELGEIWGEDMKLLRESFKSGDQCYVTKTMEAIDAMIEKCGFYSDLCDQDVQSFRVDKLPSISLDDLRMDCIEPLSGDLPCIMSEGGGNGCMAFKDHGVTLRRSKLAGVGGAPKLCSYCEIYLVGYIFEMFKKKSTPLMVTLNRWTVKRSLDGELSDSSLLSQLIPDCQYGLQHPFPRYNRDMWRKCTYPDRKSGSVCRGLMIKSAYINHSS